MIPTNSNNLTNCDPISSNCVIWQGPDLPCVEICTGDTISTVIAALCTELQLLQTLIENGGGSTFNIANIDQSELSGGPATNLEELIQLMITNIVLNQGGGSSSGGGSSAVDCDQVFKCAVTTPGCFREATGFTQGSNLGDWIDTVSQFICDQSNTNTTTNNNSQALTQRVAALESQPTGEANPRMYSSGAATKGQLLPIETIVQAIDSQFVTLRGTTGTPSNMSTGVNTEPTDLATPVSSEGYRKTLKTSPATLGDSTYNTWLAIDDLRKAVKHIQDNCCANTQITRMGGINSFYAPGSSCSVAATNAGTASNCLDIWNVSGVQFDTTCKAYTSPYNPSSATELVNNQWYALCAGGPMAQYNVVAPHWRDQKTTCGEGGK